MELLESFPLITAVKMGGATKLLVKFPSMEVSNLLKYTRSGVADFCIFPILGITLRPYGGAVVVSLVPMVILVQLLSLEDGVEYLLIPL